MPKTYYDEPPVFTIDLSLPPADRYVNLALHFKDEIPSLTELFDDFVYDFIPGVPVKAVKSLARFALHRLHSREENEEIRGISRVTGVPMWLLVAFNVLLDLMMGCTSGAARTKDPETGAFTMLHFRTLDWGMDELRDVIVQLDFIRSPSKEVIASSITYAGFVGVLTGVRQNLSMSLNFRPNHDTSSPLTNLRFYSHQLLVLLGIRPSISSHIRQLLLPSDSAATVKPPPSLSGIAQDLPGIPTTACYLTFSDGAETITLEKDHRTAQVRSSSSFLVTTNHDVCTPPTTQSAPLNASKPQLIRNVSMADLIEESIERRDSMVANWDRKVRRAESQRSRKAAASRTPQPSPAGNDFDSNPRITRSTKSRLSLPRKHSRDHPHGASSASSSALSFPAIGSLVHVAETGSDHNVSASPGEVKKWGLKWPVTNECTHFASILDPTRGCIMWVRRFIEPVRPPKHERTRSQIAAGRC